MEKARKEKLDEICQDLSQIEGVRTVQSDDWDSNAVNVFIFLEVFSPFKFFRPLRSVKSDIRKELKEPGFNFLHWPSKRNKKKYESYDCSYVKVEVFV